MSSSRFLDLEAEDRGRYSTDESSDEESLKDFFEDIEDRSSNTRPLRRWNDEEDSTSLEEITRDIRNRYRQTVCRPILNIQNVDRLPPSTNDHGIWRIRVKDGREHDVVFALFQVTLTSDTDSTSILSAAFCRDTIAGWIYVEAASLDPVTRILTGLSDVRLFRNALQSESVPLEERIGLLHMKDEYTIKELSWVRTLTRGRYRRDLALVSSVNHQNRTVVVLLVPRIHINRKRDRQGRAKQALFNFEEVIDIFGYDSVKREKESFFFKGDEYVHGLVRLKVDFSKVTDQSVNASQFEINLFFQTRTKWIVDAVSTGLVKLRVSDRVQVVNGPFQGLSGRLVDIEEHHTMIFESDGLPCPQRVRTWEIRKKFIRGDFVRVICGEHSGVKGFIVDIDQNSAFIYRRFGQTTYQELCQDNGSELIADLKHIDFAESSEQTRNTMSMDGIQSTPLEHGRDEFKVSMYTGDPYEGMEVRIHAGEGKLHGGVVIQSIKRETQYVVVKTMTRTINTTMTLNIEDVTEARSGLLLDKAKWIPKSWLNVIVPQEPQPERASTPMPDTEQNNLDLSLAWNPTSLSPIHPSTNEYPAPVETSGKQALAHLSTAGEWLRQPKIFWKRLDIRIDGTKDILWRQGRYDGKRGFTVVTTNPSNHNKVLHVKLGHEETKLTFPAKCIFPETTTERPGYVSHETATRVIHTVGCRVVIIGPDSRGNSDLIGNYAITVPHREVVPSDCTEVQIITEGPFKNQSFFVKEDSLCRSHMEPVSWFDEYIV